MNQIGVMQGRLLPQIDGRIQAFPQADWSAEFPTARRIGFDAIEFIFEGDPDKHPLLQVEGRDRIGRLVRETGVTVPSVCADFFMECPLFRGTAAQRAASVDVLRRLIQGAARVGVQRIEIPCVDGSALKTDQEKQDLVSALHLVMRDADEHGIGILLETDLPPGPFAALVRAADHPGVLVNYDTGNSAALGYDPEEEIRTLGALIGNIHIKDRIMGGTTVPLGQGNTDFPRVFRALHSIGYRGAFVLQTARDPDDVGVASRYLTQVRQWIGEHLSTPPTS
ncbi:MAG: sugar phosphate isomerase/epimerase [Gemmatimonadetes bacterium]|nr:sugar phosphate isomerase/epimerase [Gemmatimonadota bacterium]